jgi:hypothetical protein
VALVAFGAAFLTTQGWLGLLGAAASVPFCLFTSGFPLFRELSYVAIGANFVSAWLLYRQRREHAFPLLLPFMMITAVLGVFALRGIVLVRR